jgi:hypothetical protein
MHEQYSCRSRAQENNNTAARMITKDVRRGVYPNARNGPRPGRNLLHLSLSLSLSRPMHEVVFALGPLTTCTVYIPLHTTVNRVQKIYHDKHTPTQHRQCTCPAGAPRWQATKGTDSFSVRTHVQFVHHRLNTVMKHSLDVDCKDQNPS